MPEIKGAAVLDTFAAVVARGGEAQFTEIFSRMQESARKALGGTIAPSSWYPLDDFVEFLETDVRHTAGGDATVLVERGEKFIERQLRGVNKVFVRLGSPEFVVNRVAALHAGYFTGVRVETRMTGKHSALVRYAGFRAEHRILGYAIVGFFRRALEISGARGVEARFETPIEAGTGNCILELKWQ